MIKGENKHPKERTNNKFAILLPTTFPIEISAFPLIAAFMLTAASGIEVPIATTVRPITICGILKRLAMLDEPSTNTSAPFARRKNPRAKKMMFNEIVRNY